MAREVAPHPALAALVAVEQAPTPREDRWALARLVVLAELAGLLELVELAGLAGLAKPAVPAVLAEPLEPVMQTQKNAAYRSAMLASHSETEASPAAPQAGGHAKAYCQLAALQVPLAHWLAVVAAPGAVRSAAAEPQGCSAADDWAQVDVRMVLNKEQGYNMGVCPN
ncbi:hypothetical protein MSPP1_000880 [Malassezia sp. CBS 17886]|nr:hypothetical protein MSPP1_000880 [Malassezia sp. CBS 17886]